MQRLDSWKETLHSLETEPDEPSVDAMGKRVKTLGALQESLRLLVEQHGTSAPPIEPDPQIDLDALRHDLASPLGAVRSLSKILQEHHAQQLDEKGQEALSLLVDAANRLAGVLEELVHSPESPPPLRCSPQTALQAALESLRPEERNRFSIDQRGLDTRVAVPPTDLQRVFQNLLRNAVLHGGGSMSRIRVRGETHEARWRCTVEDNGQGLQIPPSSAVRPWVSTGDRRLGDQSSGLGLSIVSKLIRQNHGRFQIENSASGGCRATFELPSLN